MNDLLHPNRHQSIVGVQMSPVAPPGGVNLDDFFQDVETVNSQLRDLEAAQQRLQNFHEQSKTLYKAEPLKELRSRMDADVSLALKMAKDIKLRLQALESSNDANRAIPNCGTGSAVDRTRSSVVRGLGKKFRDSSESINALRHRISSDHRDTIGRRYFTVTGQNPNEETLDGLISTGQSETFLHNAIQQQGRGRIMEVIREIDEKQEGTKEMERSLKELQEVFLDMAVMVVAQGEELDDIESQVKRASSFVQRGTQQLQVAKKHRKNTRKWYCFAIILLLIIVLVILLIVRPW